uniref:Uncharacterized protein n=1 Tax=Plectus sambesii TaxID=2011161 RepID=A0A914X6H4_9BILA
MFVGVIALVLAPVLCSSAVVPRRRIDDSVRLAGELPWPKLLETSPLPILCENKMSPKSAPSGCRWIVGPVDTTAGCLEYQLDCNTSCPVYDTMPGCSVIGYEIVDDCPVPLTDCSSKHPPTDANSVQSEDTLSSAVADELIPMVSKRS